MLCFLLFGNSGLKSLVVDAAANDLSGNKWKRHFQMALIEDSFEFDNGFLKLPACPAPPANSAFAQLAGLPQDAYRTWRAKVFVPLRSALERANDERASEDDRIRARLLVRVLKSNATDIVDSHYNELHGGLLLKVLILCVFFLFRFSQLILVFLFSKWFCGKIYCTVTNLSALLALTKRS